VNISLELFPDEGHPVVHVSGEVDVQTGPALEESVRGLITAGHHTVVIDLGEVTFIDSSGIGALVACAGMLGGPGHLGLARPRPQVLRVLALTGLDEHLPVFDSVERARADLPREQH
jgi:anti-sigma B factor antagonist